MMDGNERKEKILAALRATEKPISASRFAKEFGVSRQIIVGDVALLRASGTDILATARGYLLQQETNQLVSKIAVQHNKTQTEEELRTIVAYGGEVIDVIVEHPLYGELVGGLHLKTEADVTRFMSDYQKAQTGLLSELTAGIHLHTIGYQTAEDLVAIKAALAKKGILYQ